MGWGGVGWGQSPSGWGTLRVAAGWLLTLWRLGLPVSHAQLASSRSAWWAEHLATASGRLACSGVRAAQSQLAGLLRWRC